MSYKVEINENTYAKPGQSAGCYNIFEDDKFKRSCTMTELEAMKKAKSRFKKDYKQHLEKSESELDVDQFGNCIYCGTDCYEGDMCDEQQAGGFNE